MVAATTHSNCGWWQWTAAVEWDATGRTDGERLLLWTTAATVPAMAVLAVAVTVAAEDSNWGGDDGCGWEQMALDKQSTSGENGRWLCQQKYDKHEKVWFLGICL
jgi:hypothetical protein